MDLDVAQCLKRNIHNRSEADIQAIVNKWEKTPNAQVPLDIRPLLQSDSITEVSPIGRWIWNVDEYGTHVYWTC